MQFCALCTETQLVRQEAGLTKVLQYADRPLGKGVQGTPAFLLTYLEVLRTGRLIEFRAYVESRHIPRVPPIRQFGALCHGRSRSIIVVYATLFKYIQTIKDSNYGHGLRGLQMPNNWKIAT